jgi:beta-N-acetylglucosaminidase
VVFTPVSGPAFTIDTDLTKPSGETAAKLDSFLSGSALAGLGASFMNAEATYHVSARYFVAHAILESAWGTSAIAHDKHNLFGYGADDANPYGDAVSFPSFDACIQFVAQKVAHDYLSPTGAFYHGPTLRGMNVDYASDPLWASKIARIANTVPD